MKLVITLVLAMTLSACGKAGSAGAPGAKGDTGAEGPSGPAGTPGAPGTPGHNGNDGQNGTPGTVIQPIQLCPGAPSYPAVFIEYAICVDNNLYGVYSANGGFLTYLPPGNYTSNGIGSACNFTVSAGCQVSQ